MKGNPNTGTLKNETVLFMSLFGPSKPTQRYSNKTKLGNWNEDAIIEQLKLAEFLEKKEKGMLMVTAMQKQLQHSLQPVPLSVSPDGDLRFGDSILLYSVYVFDSSFCIYK